MKDIEFHNSKMLDETATLRYYVSTTRKCAEWAAIRFTADHILDFIEVDDLHAICEVEVPKSWYGKTVGQVDVRRKYNLNIIGIKKNNNIDMAISSETLLNNDVTLLVLGDYKSLQKCFQI